ncbi:kinase-like domain-containing protein [Entophlyctis helioformis]|nr:kinase-like domain-containing protein [Entophlyctis helioformis]
MGIGRGGFGEVLLCQHAATRQMCAVKAMRLCDDQGSAVLANLVDAQLMGLVSHPNIIGLQDVIETSTHIFTVMDYIHSGSLASRLGGGKAMANDDCRLAMRQLVSALHYLHVSCGVVHRDLKPDNALMDGDGHIFVIDFGLAGIYSQMVKSKGPVGTLGYMAPEVEDSGMPHAIGYDGKQADMWSLGVMLYEMVYGQKPFSVSKAAGGLVRGRTLFTDVINFAASPPIHDGMISHAALCMTMMLSSRQDG